MASRATLLLLSLLGAAGVGWGVHHIGSAESIPADLAAPPLTPQDQAMFLYEGSGGDVRGDADDFRLVGQYELIQSGKGKALHNAFAKELVARQAARDPLGLYILGLVQSEDLIWPADNTQAVRNITAAAEAGHAQSQFALGTLLTAGAAGVKADPAAAERWLMRAAESGHALAAESLASELAEGRNGFPMDCQRAWDYAQQTQHAYEAQRRLGAAAWVHTPMILGLIRDDDCQGLPAMPEQAMAWLEEGARIEGAVYGNQGALLVAQLYAKDPRFKDAKKAAYWRQVAKSL